MVEILIQRQTGITLYEIFDTIVSKEPTCLLTNGDKVFYTIYIYRNRFLKGNPIEYLIHNSEFASARYVLGIQNEDLCYTGDPITIEITGVSESNFDLSKLFVFLSTLELPSEDIKDKRFLCCYGISDDGSHYRYIAFHHINYQTKSILLNLDSNAYLKDDQRESLRRKFVEKIETKVLLKPAQNPKKIGIAKIYRNGVLIE